MSWDFSLLITVGMFVISISHSKNLSMVTGRVLKLILCTVKLGRHVTDKAQYTPLLVGTGVYCFGVLSDLIDSPV